jgi:two-component system, NarL family, response regulator YdfI
MIRVAIVAESTRLRSEIARLLRAQTHFEVSESVATMDELMLDADATLVLVSEEDETLRDLPQPHGPCAVLPTSATPEQIITAVHAAATGLTVLHPDYSGSLGQAPSDDPLTPREREVLQMLAAGLGNKEIAARLAISDHTAKFHVSQILSKLNAVSRAEAVSIGMRRGLVPV